MNIEFTSQLQPQIAMDYAENAADRNGNIIDLSATNSICFVVGFDIISPGANGTLHLQAGNASDGSDFDDLAGTSFSWTVTQEKTLYLSEVERLEANYIRLVVKKPTANTSGESAICFLYNTGRRPVTKTFPTAFHLAPRYGTP